MTVILELSLVLGLSLYFVSHHNSVADEGRTFQLTEKANADTYLPSEIESEPQETKPQETKPQETESTQKTQAKSEIVKFPVSGNIGGPYTVAPSLHMSIYQAKKGDNLSSIAQQNDLDFFTILSVNGLGSSNKISIGQRFRIPNQRGIIHEMSKGESIEDIALMYNVNIRKIIRVNQILDPAEIKVGTELFIPDAKMTLEFQKDLLVKSGVESEKKEEIKEVKNSKIRVVNNGKIRVVNNRAQRSNRSSKGNLEVYGEIEPGVSIAMPCKTTKVSSSFGYRRDPFNGRSAFHAGTDIDTEYGDEVSAAMGGTVTYAGWMGGYGKLVVITDKNGYSTRYGHLSRINVRKGSQVKQGQLMGTVGSTGRSTGAHLHFEVRKDDKPLNPTKIADSESKVSKDTESDVIQEELTPPKKDNKETVDKSTSKSSSKSKSSHKKKGK
jgi:murein DD-endopeptidase MepM/ murein hydrolase activator NlpD